LLAGPVITTAKIARAHLNEFPDYYTRLAKMEAEAGADRWLKRRERDRKGGRGAYPRARDAGYLLGRRGQPQAGETV